MGASTHRLCAIQLQISTFSPLPLLVEHLVHSLVRQLDAQECCRVGGHGSCQRRAEAGEERAQTALAVYLTNDTANRHIALRRLQPRLDRVDGENRDPHGHTGGGASTRNGRQAELTRGFARSRVHGGQFPLDILVRGKVGRGAGAIAGQGGGGSAEDGAQATLTVERADDIDTA